MKYISLFCLALMIPFTTSAQSTTSGECQQYRKGNFSYTDSIGQVIIVKRTPHKQIETNCATNIVTQFRIHWTGDCAYEIKQIWSSGKAQRKYNGNTTGVIISKPLGETGYEYTCACKDENVKEIAGVMRRL